MDRRELEVMEKLWLLIKAHEDNLQKLADLAIRTLR